MEANETKRFESWAVLEIMGHQRFAGLVSEQAIGGSAFVRIDVSAVGDYLPVTKLFGQGSIFCITPCSEEVARNVAANCYDRPIEVYSPSVGRKLTYDGDLKDPDG